jgi:hypothetical protein
MNCVGVGGGDSTANLEILPNTFCKKIRETLKSARAIFNVFSRYRVDSGKIRNGIEVSTPVAT